MYDDVGEDSAGVGGLVRPPHPGLAAAGADSSVSQLRLAPLHHPAHCSTPTLTHAASQTRRSSVSAIYTFKMIFIQYNLLSLICECYNCFVRVDNYLILILRGM